MRIRCLPILFAIATAALPAWGAPTVAAAYNAASYTKRGHVNGGLPQGGMFVVFGTNMGPANLVVVNAFPIPTTLAGTQVRATVGGVSRNCPVVYTSANQMAAILPSNTPVGAGTLVVLFNNEASPPIAIEVVRSAFGIFTLNQAGSGPAVIQKYVSQTELPVNTIGESFTAGQTGILWGTGLGPIAGDDAGSPPVGNLAADVKLYIGDKLAKLVYYGRSGCCSAIDQIVFEVPAGITGCYLPLVVYTNGIPSNWTTISIASQGKVCSDAGLGLEKETVEKILKDGKLRIGKYQVAYWNDRSYHPTGVIAAQATTNDALLRFQEIPASVFANGARVSGFGASTPVPNTCVVNFYEIPSRGPAYLQTAWLDAGASATLSGGQANRVINASPRGSFFLSVNTLNPDAVVFVSQNTKYTIQWSGSAGIPAGMADVQYPLHLNWLNKPDYRVVNRNLPLKLQWTNSEQYEFVQILGSSVNYTEGRGASFLCTVSGTAKEYTVPPEILKMIPATIPANNDSLAMLIVTALGKATNLKVPGVDWFQASVLSQDSLIMYYE